jgi:hypothetical protein
MPKDDPGGEFWELIAPHTGAVAAVRHTERGYTSHVTAIVECESGPVFIKAVREPGPHASSFRREALINPYVRSVSPALRWSLQDGQWIALGFDVAAGRCADVTTGSPDLAAVAETIAALAHIPCPEVARDWPETRWNRFTDTPHLFAGKSLLHTDLNPDNLIVDQGRATLVDWAWPTLGAGFIDPACLVLQLISAGHSPGNAEGWAQRTKAWQDADPAAIDAFAAANVRMFRHAETLDPASWRRAMTQAATAWADHRGVSL